MDITLIGWLIISITIYSLIRNRGILIYIVVGTSVFTAASVINIHSSTTGILPFYFTGAIWVATCIFKYIKQGVNLKETVKSIKIDKFIRALLIFFSIILLSEVVLIIFNGFTYLDTNSSSYLTVNFNKSNITQPIYLIFMIVMAIFMYIEVNTKEKIKNIIKVFLIATTFTLIWGIIQFCMYYMNIEYPHWLFNNNIAYDQLYYQMIYGLKRVNSVALEPSTYSLNIIMFLGIVMTVWISGYKVLQNKYKNNLMLLSLIIIALICGILTVSTTAYIGIALIIISLTIYILFLSKKNGEFYKNKKRVFFFYFFIIVSICFVLFLAIQVFDMYWKTLWDALIDITVNKKNLQTGNERINAIKTSINILRTNPITGIGFGSFRSLDLITNLLSNMGILGLASFIYILVITFKNIFVIRESNEIISISLFISIFVSSIALSVSIPDLLFGYYWIFIAVANRYAKIKVEDRL